MSSSKYHRSATVLWDWPGGGGGDPVLLPDLLDRAMARTHVDSGVFLVRREERPAMLLLSPGFPDSKEVVLVMSEAYRSGPGAEMVVRRLAAWSPGSGAEAKR